MKKLILIGGGGHSLSCIDVIISTKKFKIIGLIDKNKNNKVIKHLNLPYLGEDKNLNKLNSNDLYAFVTIGQIRTSNIRKKIFKKLIENKFKIPTIISPSSLVSKSSIIKEGSIIMHKAFVNAFSRIAENCIINSNSVIEHESIIEKNCHISTGVIINGGCKVKEGTFIGSGSVLGEGVTIGKNSIISAQSKILKNLPNNSIIK